MKTTVIYHSADFDGIFCREIARKFLGNENVEFIGWNFGDKPLEIPKEGTVYVMDLPVDRVFGLDYTKEHRPVTETPRALTPLEDLERRLTWIDHHKSSIETHPPTIPGVRIDGVAACRLAWQWFYHGCHAGNAGDHGLLPDKMDFVDRQVNEPLAVRLAGEYDIWDHEKSEYLDITFQFGLREKALTAEDWQKLLDMNESGFVQQLLSLGAPLHRYQQQCDAEMMKRSTLVQFERLTFLALNTARCNSLTFAAKDVAETGHDALLAFYWKNGMWHVSLYHARHRKDVDILQMATSRGGGGHAGACGFRANTLPFLKGKQPAEAA